MKNFFRQLIKDFILIFIIYCISGNLHITFHIIFNLIGLGLIVVSLVGLYYLNKYYEANNKGIDVPIVKVLPDFIINWLEKFKLFSKDEYAFKELKKALYGDVVIGFTIFIMNMLIIILYLKG